MIVGDLLFEEFAIVFAFAADVQARVDFDDVGVGGSELVAGAIAADDDVFGFLLAHSG